MTAQGDPNVKPGRRDEAPWDAVDELFHGITTCMWNEHRQEWDARARGCSEFAHAKTPAAAMRAAMDLKEGKRPPAPRPRAVLPDDPAPMFTARRRLS
jgi:hypothetical protein